MPPSICLKPKLYGCKLEFMSDLQRWQCLSHSSARENGLSGKTVANGRLNGCLIVNCRWNDGLGQARSVRSKVVGLVALNQNCRHWFPMQRSLSTLLQRSRNSQHASTRLPRPTRATRTGKSLCTSHSATRLERGCFANRTPRPTC